MKSYCIRTGGTIRDFYLRLLYLLLWYVCLIWFLLEHFDWVRHNFLLYFAAGFVAWNLILYADHFFLTQITEVALSDDGVEANWGNRFPFFKTVRKKIMWEEISNYKTQISARGWFSLSIVTNDGGKYVLLRRRIPLFLKDDDYDGFINNFKTIYEIHTNGG